MRVQLEFNRCICLYGLRAVDGRLVYNLVPLMLTVTRAVL